MLFKKNKKYEVFKEEYERLKRLKDFYWDLYENTRTDEKYNHLGAYFLWDNHMSELINKNLNLYRRYLKDNGSN
jgi:hypothetical protein